MTARRQTTHEMPAGPRRGPKRPDEEESAAAIDPTVLEAIETLAGDEAAAAILSTAVDGMRTGIAAILRGADAGDIEGVERNAHALISTAGAVGAVHIGELAAAIEAEAGRGTLDPRNPHIADLTPALRRFEEAAEVEPE